MASPQGSRRLVVDMLPAPSGSQQAVATAGAKLRHPPPARRPASPEAQARPAVLDPWRELEAVIDRLARLVLHAHALAARTAALPALVETPGRQQRAARLDRLRLAVDLGQRAITAAIALT